MSWLLYKDFNIITFSTFRQVSYNDIIDQTDMMFVDVSKRQEKKRKKRLPAPFVVQKDSWTTAWPKNKCAWDLIMFEHSISAFFHVSAPLFLFVNMLSENVKHFIKINDYSPATLNWLL